MQLRVRYFAALREQAGVGEEPVEVADGATAAQLLATLQARHPRAAGLLALSRVAQNDAFVAASAALVESVADVIPPVSGG